MCIRDRCVTVEPLNLYFLYSRPINRSTLDSLVMQSFRLSVVLGLTRVVYSLCHNKSAYKVVTTAHCVAGRNVTYVQTQLIKYSHATSTISYSDDHVFLSSQDTKGMWRAEI